MYTICHDDDGGDDAAADRRGVASVNERLARFSNNLAAADRGAIAARATTVARRAGERRKNKDQGQQTVLRV